MIVDDHPGSRDAIRRVLDFPGVVVLECICGESAVLLVNIFEPDWVTMDIRMPGLNGIQATEMLRKKYPARPRGDRQQRQQRTNPNRRARSGSDSLLWQGPMR